MGLRQYVNNAHKELQLGNNQRAIKFRDGLFETDDKETQQFIESSQGFGVSIHFKDSIAEMERIGKEREEKEGVERARKKKELLDEIEADEKKATKKKADKELADKELADKDKTKKKLSAADKVL